MKSLFLYFGKFLHLIFPQAAVKYFYLIKRTIYAGFKLPEFKKTGKRILIEPFVTIIGGKYISLGDNVSLSKGTVLSAWDKRDDISFEPQIIIGNDVSIGSDCHITAINRIEIGNGVLLGKKITLTDNSHGKSIKEHLIMPPIKRPLFSKGPLIIEDNVWIGDKATILAGITIGKNSIIGANSVVTKDVPANCIIAGNPAKIVKSV